MLFRYTGIERIDNEYGSEKLKINFVTIRKAFMGNILIFLRPAVFLPESFKGGYNFGDPS